jgi:DNA replication and repair protein RecF
LTTAWGLSAQRARLSSLRLDRFRNLQPLRLESLEDRSCVFLIGENGQGKTNLLEAIYLLCFGGSFRTRQDVDLIHTGADEAVVSGSFAIDGRGGADAVWHREVTLRLRTDRAREIRVDGTRVADRGEVVGAVPCILFSHDDLRAVDGPPAELRRFFDQTAALSDPAALPALRRYRRVLMERNALMRSGPSDDLLDVYDRQLIDAGLVIRTQRSEIIADYAERFADIFHRVTASDVAVSIRYQPSWASAAADEVVAQMRSARRRDHGFATTTTGPHRDRFPLRIDGLSFRRYASTGQKRLASLALRAAQAARVAERSRTPPLLLLDDVLLELDAGKRERFLAALPAAEQRFFTFLPDERFDRYELGPTLRITVRDGSLTPWTS